MADSRKRKPVSQLKPKPTTNGFDDIVRDLKGDLRRCSGMLRLARTAQEDLQSQLDNCRETLRQCAATVAERDRQLADAQKAIQKLRAEQCSKEQQLQDMRRELAESRMAFNGCERKLVDQAVEKLSLEKAYASQGALYQGFLKQNEEMKQLAGFLRTSYIAETMSGRHDGKTVAEIVIMHLRVERQIPGWVKLLFRWRVPKPDLPKPIRKSLDGLDETEG